jgi:AcrR family transcriptional regulator
MTDPLIDEAPKDRLLSSAAKLMAEKGFEGVSVREICHRAGTSNNMVHHYFGSKQGLLDAIVEQFSTHVFAIPLRIMDKTPDTREEFRSVTELLFETTLEAFIDNRDVMLVVVRELADPQALPAYMERLTAFYEAAKEDGFIRTEVDTSMITGFFLDRLVNQVHFAPWVQRNYGSDLLTDPEYRRQWTRANFDVFFNGIAT